MYRGGFAVCGAVGFAMLDSSLVVVWLPFVYLLVIFLGLIYNIIEEMSSFFFDFFWFLKISFFAKKNSKQLI